MGGRIATCPFTMRCIPRGGGESGAICTNKERAFYVRGHRGGSTGKVSTIIGEDACFRDGSRQKASSGSMVRWKAISLQGDVVIGESGKVAD